MPQYLAGILRDLLLYESVSGQGDAIRQLVPAIRQLMAPPPEPKRCKIGFHRDVEPWQGERRPPAHKKWPPCLWHCGRSLRRALPANVSSCYEKSRRQRLVTLNGIFATIERLVNRQRDFSFL
jgi:hypothetical protein